MSEHNANTNARQKAMPMRGPMGGGPGAMMPGEKAKDFKGSAKKLITYLGRYRFAILAVWLLAAASAVFMIFGPRILGNATNELVAGLMAKFTGTGGVNFTAIGQTLLKLLALYLVSVLFAYGQGYIMTGVTMKLIFRLRNEIDEKIHKLPFRYYDTTTHGDVLSRITNDVDTISQTLNQSLTQVITSVTTLVGITIMMFSISWKMSLAALCSLPLTMVGIMLSVKKSQPHFVKQQGLLGAVNGHIEEIFGNRVIVKAFNGEESSLKSFDASNEKLYHSAWKANFYSGLIMPISGFIGNISYVVICILGGFLTAQGSLALGDIQSFIQYVRQFTQPISQIANISNVLQQTAAAAERVFDFLAQPEEVPDTADALGAAAVSEGHVEFRNVSFGYLPEKEVIRDFSANIKPGQKVAIVGPTGAGKTTLVKLLMRFYDVNSGAILVDGQDIRAFARNELRSAFGMVLQDTWLFHGSIADNIRYGKQDATQQEVIAAAQTAQADHFIHTLPGGYDLLLNEETNNISQGQKQLLTIARAILADPKILILDEATSNVDTRTEILIQKAMDALMQGRTSFVIAHRLSTIRNADWILVINEGDIVEQGTHTQLLEAGGFYAKLYNSQFESTRSA